MAGLPWRCSGWPVSIVLIVWDTVRAYSIGAYGYHRDTTPNLTPVG